MSNWFTRFWSGTPEKRENVSLLTPEQEALKQQAVNAGMGPGAGGAFGDSADYYRGLMGNDSADYNAFAAPQVRQYNEETIPGISEQFAGMGAGGLSSSGFRNAQVQGGVDLSERLGALRANLRQHGAQGLQQIGQAGLQPHTQNMVTQEGSEGFLPQVAPLIGTAVGAYFGGPAGAQAGYNAGKNSFGGNKVGRNTSQYGYGQKPAASPSSSNGFNLPNFMQR